MQTTMTWVGMDVHARSTHGAAIDSLSGELQRARFGGGSEEVVRWRGISSSVVTQPAIAL